MRSTVLDDSHIDREKLIALHMSLCWMIPSKTQLSPVVLQSSHHVFVLQNFTGVRDQRCSYETVFMASTRYHRHSRRSNPRAPSRISACRVEKAFRKQGQVLHEGIILLRCACQLRGIYPMEVSAHLLRRISGVVQLAFAFPFTCTSKCAPERKSKNGLRNRIRLLTRLIKLLQWRQDSLWPLARLECLIESVLAISCFEAWRLYLRNLFFRNSIYSQFLIFWIECLISLYPSLYQDDLSTTFHSKAWLIW